MNPLTPKNVILMTKSNNECGLSLAGTIWMNSNAYPKPKIAKS